MITDDDDLLERTPKRSGQEAQTISCPVKEGEPSVTAGQVGAVTSLTRGAVP